MKIELKNVKHSEFASHETYCFMASVYINGKKAGSVSNHGHGACNTYHPATLETIITQHAHTLPALTYESAGEVHSMLQDADCVIGDLMNAWLFTRDLKQALDKRILFINKDGELRQTKTITPKAKLNIFLASPEHYLKSLNGCKVLNLLPFDEALSIYRQETA
jgi:hypothetical protein